MHKINIQTQIYCNYSIYMVFIDLELPQLTLIIDSSMNDLKMNILTLSKTFEFKKKKVRLQITVIIIVAKEI